ncbi:glycoside hydrolase family 13 protein [Natronococcus jeotgali]|uniref:Alpha amylase n=1 Tax=Natronococcus jeotgali DSM 18795 TaxID=1227498 RepID=L9WSG3_9EURY|nr:alpha-glucosidase [Natronococcus jeotgali]ELY52372.1 alpha amylase [Natronococcus jeotgali DSM 18795]
MSRSEPLERADRAWWKEAVVYQIYPRSFNDSDGDGVGDIPGIAEKVDYLERLGVDVIWLCPVYDSPNHDNGYDIRDYRSILDAFGTMADWEELLEKLHARDMRLIMDLVVNHTSSEHEWFRRSRRRDGKYEDYYHWEEGRPAAEADYETADGPAGEVAPNNWDSIFGGPAWSYDEERGQWYLHIFDAHQPDLNWRNPAVRADVEGEIEWWLEKGIDGFRMDAIDLLSKAEGLPDGDPDDALVGSEHYSHGPRLREYLRELYDDVLSNYDAMTVGEMGMASVEAAADSIGENGDGLDMVFQFDHMNVDAGENGPWGRAEPGEWKLTELKEIVSRKQRRLEWDALFLSNHDVPRLVSRFGDDDRYREESATLIATFLLTMRGTPYVYQGDEIGMTNADFRSREEIDDPQTLGTIDDLLEAGAIDSYEDVREFVNYRSRDHARTPVQWTDSPGAGFTDGEPWLKVNENRSRINVEAAIANGDSVWHYYRRLIELRDAEDVLVYGEYDLLLPEDEQLFAYVRTLEDERALIVLNWSAEPAVVDGLGVAADGPDVLVGNYDDPPTAPEGSELRPYEAVVYRLG